MQISPRTMFRAFQLYEYLVAGNLFIQLQCQTSGNLELYRHSLCTS